MNKPIRIIVLGIVLAGIGYMLGGLGADDIFFELPFSGASVSADEMDTADDFSDTIEEWSGEFAGSVETWSGQLADNLANWGEQFADRTEERFAEEPVTGIEKDGTTGGGNSTDKKTAGSVSGEINRLFLKSKVAEVYIETSDEIDELTYRIFRIKPQHFSIEKRGDTLHFEDKTPVKFLKRVGFTPKKKAPKIYIRIPLNRMLKNVEIDNGVGRLTVNGLQAETFDLNTGVGTTNLNNLEIFTSASIKGGVGRTDIRNSKVKNMRVQNGVGSFRFSGKAAGKTDIKGGIGSIRLAIDGAAKDYTFDVTTGIGSVKINGQKVSRFLNSRQQKSGTDGGHSIHVTGGIGSVRMQFKEE